MFNAEPKPALWAFDLSAIDPFWVDNFWSDCVACVPAWEATSGSAPPQILSGKRFDTAKFCSALSSPTSSAAGDGPALGLTNGNDWRLPNSPDILPTARVTYLIVRKKRDTAINNTHSFGHALGASGERCGGHAPYLDGTVYWDFGGIAGANRITWAGYTPSTNVEKWAFVAGANGSAIYFNGLKVASQTTGISRTVQNSPIGIATGNGITTNNDADFLFFAIMDAEWGAGQVAEWAQDPYAPIRLSQNDATAAAAGTGILSSAGIGAAAWIGAANDAAVVSSAGVGAASWVSSAINAAVLSSAGVSDAEWAGNSLAGGGALSSAGVGTAAWVGAGPSTVGTVSSAGTGAASWISAAISAAVLNAAGTGALNASPPVTSNMTVAMAGVGSAQFRSAVNAGTTTGFEYPPGYGRYASHDRNPKSWINDGFVEEPDY